MKLYELFSDDPEHLEELEQQLDEYDWLDRLRHRPRLERAIRYYNNLKRRDGLDPHEAVLQTSQDLGLSARLLQSFLKSQGYEI